MPVLPCKWPTCCSYVRPGERYCPEHAQHVAADRRERDRFYDQHQRNPEAKAFYNSAEWRRARATKLSHNPVCERCQRAFAQHVHHIKPLSQCTPAERIAQDNLFSACIPCHNAIEAEAHKQ